MGGLNRHSQILRMWWMEEKIKVYGTQWCPDCVRAKQVLTRHKVDFEWIDIGKDEAAAAYVEKVNRGYKSVPTILFADGSVLVEPSNRELEAKLAGGK
jgi:mycoredoxin